MELPTKSKADKMNNRLVIYFQYDPRGQADTACRFAVQAMRKQARAFLFVHNGPIHPDTLCWLREEKIDYLERENVGLDVGAYRDALAYIGRTALDGFDEVVLMNYTLAGPVCSLERMFDTMQARPELDFWGLSRHYAMHSRRFGTGGNVPEHIQSHFIAVRRRMYDDFWQYWMSVRLPGSYEESIRFHETRFTAYFSSLGYQWDTFVNGDAWRNIFVNPIMGCPKELVEQEGCPFFKRRSFFTPYADELRRTDGCAAAALYRYLKSETSYPVDALIRSLLTTQSLAEMAQNLHWHYRIPENGEKLPTEPLSSADLASGAKLCPDKIYFLPIDLFAGGTARWYEERCRWDTAEASAAASLFRTIPFLGVLGPALSLYPEAEEIKWKKWNRELPRLRLRMQELALDIPVCAEQPLPVPNGGCLLLRGAAFPQGLPPIRETADLWLLPLVAQSNGFSSADAEPDWQSAARADVQQAFSRPLLTIPGAGKLLARRIKHKLLSRKEGDQ